MDVFARMEGMACLLGWLMNKGGVKPYLGIVKN